MRIEGIRFRREEVGAVRTHLMKVNIDHRVPVLDDPDAPLRFRLRHDEPVTVQVEQVVIRATARPGLIVFCRNPVGIRHQSFRTGEVLQETIASIRILHRVDDHNGIVQDLRCPGITTRSE